MYHFAICEGMYLYEVISWWKTKVFITNITNGWKINGTFNSYLYKLIGLSLFSSYVHSTIPSCSTTHKPHQTYFKLQITQGKNLVMCVYGKKILPTYCTVYFEIPCYMPFFYFSWQSYLMCFDLPFRIQSILLQNFSANWTQSWTD